ncbi:CrcB family protein [Lentilactobacillus senioris]|uniref:fluoride efflux transporter FluC n=1 Tax=Lentilactobacillus senioris TaxID=931534 RepID=UPI00227F288B|nr:CrcB family protein [Lentilactobacillus senioris]MCY9806496.1 CrcB family protein [Lentilactobacillus senioris]
MNYLVVACFAFLGGVTRYGISLWLAPTHGFPVATLLVNLVGCFLLAFISHYVGEVSKLPSSVIVGMGTGFVGAMTTFSTFSNETLQMFLHHQYGLAFMYDGISLFGGLLISWTAIWLSRQLVERRRPA